MVVDDPVFAHAAQVLHGLPDQIKQTQLGLENINLGPYNIDVRCRHGFLGFYGEHYTGTVDFGPNYRPRLQAILNWAANQSPEFDPLYQQLHSWFNGRLQQISDDMNDLRALSQQLIGADPNVLPLVRKTIGERIHLIIDLLTSSSEQLSQIDQGFGSFLQQVGSYDQMLTQIETQLEQNIQTVTDQASANINSWECGSGDGYGQLNAWTVSFQASTRGLAENVGSLNRYTTEAVACLAQIVGQVTNTLAQFQPVVTQFDQAMDADLSKYMELLHLDIACDLWSSLAARALNPNA